MKHHHDGCVESVFIFSFATNEPLQRSMWNLVWN